MKWPWPARRRRSWKTHVPLLTAAVIIVVLALTNLAGEADDDAASIGARPTPSAAGRVVAYVTRVIDGDTFDATVGGTKERVRLIGIDTPETLSSPRPAGCFADEASDFARTLLDGKAVDLEKDVSDRDSGGRLLRYVYLDGAMVNEMLVRDGYARAVTFPPDVKHQDRFVAAEAQARVAGRGLWGPACRASLPSGPRETTVGAALRSEAVYS